MDLTITLDIDNEDQLRKLILFLNKDTDIDWYVGHDDIDKYRSFILSLKPGDELLSVLSSDDKEYRDKKLQSLLAPLKEDIIQMKSKYSLSFSNIHVDITDGSIILSMNKELDKPYSCSTDKYTIDVDGKDVYIFICSRYEAFRDDICNTLKNI